MSAMKTRQHHLLFLSMVLLLLASFNSVAAFVSPNVSRHHKSKQSNTITQINAIDPSFIAGGIAITGATAAWWILGAQDRENKAKYAEYEALQLEREKLAFIETRETPWLEEELKAYNGENDPSGPILLAVKGDVFNVWKGRNFYGPDGEYHIMAGRDATRFLAKNRLEEETEDEKKVPLNIAERASLEAWYWTIKNKYQFVGNLAGYDPTSTKM